MTKRALEGVGGFQVLRCVCGQDAAEDLHDFALDFILLGVMMPGMDGPQTLAHTARQIDIKPVPVVLTAKVQPGEIGCNNASLPPPTSSHGHALRTSH